MKEYPRTKQLILHIPHSSENIPHTRGYVVNRAIIDEEILKLTDWHTDDLFSFEDSIDVKANFSRVFCDTERFSDDSQEVMAKFGMGVLYEKADDGSVIRKINQEVRDSILNEYYWPHHEKLNKAVEKQLNAHGKALIIDCHSFPNIPFNRSLNTRMPRPDFNIGTDSFHTPNYLIELSKDFFTEKGYTIGIDWPYSGSIVPLKYYKQNKNVESIMLEVNRRLYLKEGTNEKSENYLPIKEVVSEYLEMIQIAFNK